MSRLRTALLLLLTLLIALLIVSNLFPDQVFASLQRFGLLRSSQAIDTDIRSIELQQSRIPQEPAPPYGYTLLPTTEATQISKLCSRSGPKFDGTWQPAAVDLAALESNLQHITTLQIEEGLEQFKIANPTQFYRQYVGIVIKGKRMIYINAFRYPDDPKWRERLVIICDGGTSVWGALYDPSTGEFSHLATNGLA